MTEEQAEAVVKHIASKALPPEYVIKLSNFHGRYPVHVLVAMPTAVPRELLSNEYLDFVEYAGTEDVIRGNSWLEVLNKMAGQEILFGCNASPLQFPSCEELLVMMDMEA